MSHHKQDGARLIPLGIVLLIGFGIWLIPKPEAIDPRGWQLLAIFAATVAGIILRPLPMGAVALIGVAVVVATHTLPLDQALDGFSNDQVWLIVIACFIARGFIKTGLGKRIAYYFLHLFGKSPLGLAYGFLISDMVMAPAIPSSTARAGGVIMPILESVAQTLGSRSDDGTSRRIGEFLTISAFHGTVISTATYLTAGASNPIIAKLAAASGVAITWALWFQAAIVPSLICLALIPWIVYKVRPPEIKDTTHASTHAKEKLVEMGKISRHEKMMLITFVMLLVLWIFGKEFSLHATTSAMLGLSFLMLTGVLKWKDILTEEIAWDSLIWFSVLVMMATNLNSLGVIGWFGTTTVYFVAGMQWHHALLFLIVVYFYLHYFFASVTARVSALYAPFLAIAIAVGSPALLAAMALGYFSIICGGLTHYGMGQAPVFFSMHYVPMKVWWKLGAILSFTYLIIWLVVGGLWWKVLGLW